MHPIERLLQKQTRTVAGLMSGTSLDGIDVAIARLSGHGPDLRLEQLAFETVPYPAELQRLLLKNSAAPGSSVYDIAQLNVRVAIAYDQAIRTVADKTGVPLAEIDLVGSHGQTIHHVPEPADCAGIPVTSTLQIGDPSVLANRIEIPVVGDFRLADMAQGGQGAPLVPYFDYVCFGWSGENRGLLNIGGIGNITVVPGNLDRDQVFAFDTGPGNMIVDDLAMRFFQQQYDADGRHARQGTVMDDVLADLLVAPYFVQPPPKSTGRERFGREYVDIMLAETSKKLPDPGPHDWLATATALTAYSIYQAYHRFIRNRFPLDVLIVSGGGARNTFLMEKLAQVFAPIPVKTTMEYGVDPDAKEALCFAVLAHETIDHIPTGMAAVTGARKSTVLGKICLPGS